MRTPGDHPDNQLLTRRSLFIGAAASLICAPAVIRVTKLMPVRRIIQESDLYQYGFSWRLWALGPLPTILKRQNAGLSANEIAVEMNEGRRAKKMPDRPWPPAKSTDWDARRVFEVIRRNEVIRRSDAINRAYHRGGLVYVSDFPELPSIERYLANEEDR